MTTDNSMGYGERLIPQILDRLAASDPDRTVYSVAEFSGDSPQFRHTSARNFAKAVDKTAWWIREKVGTHHESSSGQENGTQNGQSEALTKIMPLGYIGPRKSRHPAKKIRGLNQSIKMTCATFY